MALSEKFALLKRKAITHKVAGQDFEFWPVGVRLFPQLKEIMEPIMEAVRVLMAGNQDTPTMTESVTDPQTGHFTQVQSRGAPSIEIATFRDGQKRKAMQGAMAVLLGDETRMQIGRLLVDSLRGEFGKGAYQDDAVVQEFIDAEWMDFGVFAEFINGWLKANAEVFGPLGAKVRGFLETRLRTAVSGEPMGDPITEGLEELQAEVDAEGAGDGSAEVTLGQ